jgi:uncharacterized cupredoxin-like copper-binding protein
MKRLKRLAVLVIALATSTAFAHGDGHAAKKPSYDASNVEERAFGREGDPRKVTRTFRLDMTDSFRFTPANVAVKRGETVRFIVANSGKVLHEMVLGTTEELKAHAELMKKFPGMEHADANMAHVSPGARGQIVWQFTKAGEYQFACLIPGHYEAGMVGKVVVK